jgi:hypothetical protein
VVALPEKIGIGARVVVEQHDACPGALDDAPVHGEAVALIAGIDQIAQLQTVGERLSRAARIVDAAVVDDQDLEPVTRIVERADALETLRERIGAAVGRNHDGIARSLGGHRYVPWRSVRGGPGRRKR